MAYPNPPSDQEKIKPLPPRDGYLTAYQIAVKHGDAYKEDGSLMTEAEWIAQYGDAVSAANEAAKNANTAAESLPAYVSAAQAAQTGAEAARDTAVSAVAGIDAAQTAAENAAATASTSATSAANSATSAKTSADGAASSADSAKADATSAASSANAAAASATSAATAKSAAESSKSGAEASASAAASSATAAKTSETNAKASSDSAARAAQTAANETVAATERKLAEYVSNAETAEANAKTAQAAAEKARDEAAEIAGGDFASKTEAQGYANTAESNANAYTDKKIAEIPTPDVSGQISTHNTATDAHADIRTLVSNAASAASAAQSTADEAKTAAQNAQATADGKEASGTAASAVSAHNTNTSAHNDIRTAVNNAVSAANSRVFTAVYGTTTFAEIKAAYEDGATVLCIRSDNAVKYILTGLTSTTAHFMGIGSSSNILYRVYVDSTWHAASFTCASNTAVADAASAAATAQAAANNAQSTANTANATALASAARIGDIKVTTRTDLGDNWLLCNGTGVDQEKYEEFSEMIPDIEAPGEWSAVFSVSSYSYVLDCCEADDYIYLLTMDAVGAPNYYVVTQFGKYGNFVSQAKVATTQSPTPTMYNDRTRSISVVGDTVYIAYTNNQTVYVYTGSFSEAVAGDLSNWEVITTQIATTKYVTHRYINGVHNFVTTSSNHSDSYAFYHHYCENLIDAPTSIRLGNASSVNSSFDLMRTLVDSNNNMWVVFGGGGYYQVCVAGVNTSSHKLITSLVNTSLSNSYYDAYGISLFEYDGYVVVTAPYYSSTGTRGHKISLSDYSVSSISHGHTFQGLYKYDGNLYGYAGGKLYQYYLTAASSTVSSSSTEIATVTNTNGVSYSFTHCNIGHIGGYISTMSKKTLPSISFDGAYAYIKALEG